MRSYVVTTVSRFLPILGITGLLATPVVSHAHANLVSPPPRDSSTGIKDPQGPCGPTPRSATPVVYQPGQTITVKWEESVYHPGCYLIDFSPANDTNWQVLATLPHDASTSTPISYTAQVTLPQTPCTACTLRVRQLMLSVQGTCPPPQIAAGQTYYSCSDIALGGTQITADLGGTAPADMAVASPDAKTPDAASPMASGCHAAPAGVTTGSLSGLALLALAALGLRRRRSA